MKIEPNKFYRTRDGRKVRIYAVDGGGNLPIHGAILNHEEWAHNSWEDDGRYFTDGHAKSPSDIVGEWEEPRSKRVAWINREKSLIVFVEPYAAQTPDWERAPWLDEV